MPLVIEPFDLYPGDRDGEAALRAVFEAAADACPPGVTWRISAQEGPGFGGTKIRLVGPRLTMFWTPWQQESEGVYVQCVLRDGRAWPQELTESIRLMLRRDQAAS